MANVAHASAALLGVLLGYAIAIPRRRLLLGAGIAALVACGLCGATFARPLVNLSSQGGYEEGKRGYNALIANNNQEALRWLRDAVKYKPKVAPLWFDLGIAYQRLANIEAASSAYQRAYRLEPTNPEYAQAAGRKTGAN